VTPNAALRLAARHEAEFVQKMRALDRVSPHRGPDPRPVLTALRRRPHRRTWVFRLEHLDGYSHVLWSDLVGIASGMTGVTAADRRAVRAALDVDTHVAAAMQRRHTALSRRVLKSIEPSLQMARSRELAIVEAVAARRARLAAMLIQPGLFGQAGSANYVTRSAAADDLLHRCEAHLHRLEGSFVAVAGRAELVFGFLGD
jgi:hypothetical protein